MATPYRRALLPALLLGVALTSPAAAQDGRIAFVSYRDATTDFLPPTELYVMNADGSGQTRLTVSPEIERSPRFSADGRRIAYLADGDLHVIGADGTGHLQLTADDRWRGRPSFSPDGTRILFTLDGALHSVATDGSDERVLAAGISGDVAVHPSGGLIAYECAGEICVAGLDGAGAHAITATTQQEAAPAFSRDGGRLAFVRRDAPGGGLVTANLDGSGQAIVVPTVSGVGVGAPAFSPTGSRLVFEGTQIPALGSASGLHAVAADGTGLVRLTCTTGDMDPAWAPAISPLDAGSGGPGCELDSDADGVPDSRDRCPAQEGRVEFEGCAEPPLTPENAYAQIQSKLGDPVRALVQELRSTPRRAIVRKGAVKASDVLLLFPGRLTLEVRTAKGKVLLRGGRTFRRALSHEVSAKLRRGGRRILPRRAKVRAIVALRFTHVPGVAAEPVVYKLPVTLWRR